MHSLAVLLMAGAALVAVPLAAFAEPKADSSDLLEKKTFTGADGKTLPYRLLKPTGLDPDKKVPLVVFLHGAGERGDDNAAQLKHGVREFLTPENRKDRPCFLIAPQCPAGARWVEVDWSADAHTQPKEPSGPMKLLLGLMDQTRKDYPIDLNRIYATGLSMGGFGTWDLIARRPDLFAAAVPVCGGGDAATAPKIAQLPIWAFHGAKDPVVKVGRSRAMIEALKKAGGEPKYTEYPDAGHDSWVSAYKDADMMKWLFGQKKG